MNERLVFLILLGVFSLLCSIIAYWRRKAGEAAYAAIQTAESDKERDRYCRMAVMPGHRTPAACSASPVPTCSRAIRRSAVQVAWYPDGLLRTLLPVAVQCLA